MWKPESGWVIVAAAFIGGVCVRTAASRVAAGLLVTLGLAAACDSIFRSEKTPESQGATPSKSVKAADHPGPPPADAQKTASGLVMQVLRPGRGDRKPQTQDKVRVHFTGWNSKGKRFENTRVHGKPATFDVNGVIPGLSETLQLMKVGERRRAWVPDALAYPGRPGSPRKPLVFDIELLEILEGPAPLPAPVDLAAPPADAFRKKSGLAYRWLERSGSQRKPNPWDRVRLDYTGWTADGEMFDSSIRLGKPATFDIEEVIPGWAEVLPQMAVGDRMRLWVPESLAYKGRLGRPKGRLVFDIALRSIQARPAPPVAPTHLKAPPKRAKRTASGLAYRVLEKGRGKRRPTATSRVEIHYSGWTTEGKLFDSSVVRGHPATIPLNRVIAGWTEGLQMMVQGDKYRFWIPEKLAYDKHPGRPQGMLVYEIELLKILP